MSSSKSPEESPAASLVGSLSVFKLSDVLSLLAYTSQTGEVRVVSDQVDGRLWLADGNLSNAQVGTATTIGQAVFELACATDGWLHFTVGLTSSSGQPTVPVAAVLNEVRPQVEEWREIRRVIPLESQVTLSPTAPNHDIQIRSDQWRVLTAVGNGGHTVKEVLEQIGGEHIVGLRTLRDLYTAGLIALDPAPGAHDALGDAPGTVSGGGPVAGIGTLPPPPRLGLPAKYAEYAVQPGAPPRPVTMDGAGDVPVSSLAEVAMMPPPITDDPWAPTEHTDDSGHNGVA